jgi:hypothetical protein
LRPAFPRDEDLDMQMRDLATPAEVKWQSGSDQRPDSQLFANLHQAVIYVMEQLPAQQRRAAVIDLVGQRTLAFDEIERIYRDPDFATASS